MTRALLSIALAALLVGCETVPRLPKEVKVPVPVYCDVQKPDRPAWATGTLKGDSDIYDQTKALLAERKQRIGYEQQLEAAIDGCQKPQK